MSGVIGGAGSKSGIIGITELDYETGKWTPSFTNFTNVGTVSGRISDYVKIGHNVQFWVDIYRSGDDMSWNASGAIGGLPVFGKSLAESAHSTFSAVSYSDTSPLSGYYQGSTVLTLYITEARSSQRHLWISGSYLLAA